MALSSPPVSSAATQPAAELLQVHGDCHVRLLPTCGGQLPVVEGTAAQLHQGVGVPLSTGAQVRSVSVGRPGGSQRVQRGADGRGALGVQITRQPRTAVTIGVQREPTTGERAGLLGGKPAALLDVGGVRVQHRPQIDTDPTQIDGV